MSEWINRLNNECIEIIERLKKLHIFTQSQEFKTLKETDQLLLEAQHGAMSAYSRLLMMRVDRANGWNTFQTRVREWMLKCFGAAISGDVVERNHRYLEESLELVQACGCTKSEALQLVDYVFGRPVGEKKQEVGGAMVTLAALCDAQDIDMDEAGDTELARCHEKIEKIRAKQAGKPKHSTTTIKQITAGALIWHRHHKLSRSPAKRCHPRSSPHRLRRSRKVLAS